MLLILSIFTEWLLYSAEGFRYYRVPVADGVRLTSEVVVATCKEHDMMPACFRPSTCSSPHISDKCMETPLKNCGSSTQAISQLICDGKSAQTCPKTQDMFTYMYGNSSMYACGNVDGSHCVNGNSYVSSNSRPYYAFCVL